MGQLIDSVQELSTNNSLETHHNIIDNIPIPSKEETDILYVLELQDNKYYVGITKNFEQRYNQHLNKTGSIWTQLHQPIIGRYTLEEPTGPFPEDNKVKELMLLHGIDNVRGGSYSLPTLSEDQITFIKRELSSAKDECYQCGSMNHYIGQCPYKNVMPNFYLQTPTIELNTNLSNQQKCYKCGIAGHYANNCTTISNKIVDQKCYKYKLPGHHANNSINNFCKRCGRNYIHSDKYRINGVCKYIMSRDKTRIVKDINYCSRCGYDNHSVDTCYTTKTYEGNPL
jgi:hypothetical protein